MAMGRVVIALAAKLFLAFGLELKTGNTVGASEPATLKWVPRLRIRIHIARCLAHALSFHLGSSIAQISPVEEATEPDLLRL
jgi:hypothetical protein